MPPTSPRTGRPEWSTRSTRCKSRCARGPVLPAGPAFLHCTPRSRRPIGLTIMNPGLKRLGGWLYRRAENVLAAMLAVMFFAFLLQIFFRYVMDWPTGWTNELSAILWIWMVLWGAAFVLTEQEEMRFDLIYASVGPRVRSAMFLDFRRVPDLSLCHLLPGGVRLRDLHEGREHRLSQAALRLGVFDLRRFRHRHDHSLPVAVAGRCCADRRRKSSTRPRQDPAYEHRQSLFPLDRRDHRAGAARAAGRPCDDRRLDPVSAACRPRHGNRRRAVPERHVFELHHPRRAAVHSRRRADEHRLDDGPADDLLQRHRRPLPRRAGAGQRAAVDHLRRHVGLGHRRRRRLRQDHAEHDDGRREISGRAMPRR